MTGPGSFFIFARLVLRSLPVFEEIRDVDLHFPVLLRLPGRLHRLFFGSGLLDRLRSRGILIRRADNYEGLEAGWYRIAVRRREENRQLIAALEGIREERWSDWRE